MGPRCGSRLCRLRRSPGDWRAGVSPHRTMARSDVGGGVTEGADSPAAIGASDRTKALALQLLPGWWRVRLRANPGGSGHCKGPSALSGRATRGGERRNTAVPGHRIRAVRLEWPLGPVRTRWASFPGARALGGTCRRRAARAARVVDLKLVRVASPENQAKACPVFMDFCDRFTLTSSGCSFCRLCGECAAYDDATMTARRQMETPSPKPPQWRYPPQQETRGYSRAVTLMFSLWRLLCWLLLLYQRKPPGLEKAAQ